jgi:hypothetical protein
MFTFWNYYVLELLRLETITFSDAMLSDINVVLCYILSQYRKYLHFTSRAICWLLPFPMELPTSHMYSPDCDL